MIATQQQTIQDQIKELNRAVSKAHNTEFYAGGPKTECKMRSLLASGEIGMFFSNDETFEPTLLKESLDLLTETFVIAVDNFDRKEIHNAVYDAITEARLKILWDRELTGLGWGTGLYVAFLKKIKI